MATLPNLHVDTLRSFNDTANKIPHSIYNSPGMIDSVKFSGTMGYVKNWASQISQSTGSLRYALTGMQNFNNSINRLKASIGHFNSFFGTFKVTNAEQLSNVKSQIDAINTWKKDFNKWIGRISSNIGKYENLPNKYNAVGEVDRIFKRNGFPGGIAPYSGGRAYLDNVKGEYARLNKSLAVFDKAVNKYETKINRTPIDSQTRSIALAMGGQVASMILQNAGVALEQYGDYHREEAQRIVGRGGKVSDALSSVKRGTKWKYAGSVLGDVPGYAAMGAGIGSMIPGLGTGIGAGIGAGVGLITGATKVVKDYNDDQSLQKELRSLFDSGLLESKNLIKSQHGLVEGERLQNLFASMLGSDIENGTWKQPKGYRGFVRDRGRIEKEVNNLKKLRDDNFELLKTKTSEYEYIRDSASDEELSIKLKELESLGERQKEYNKELEDAKKKLEGYSNVISIVTKIQEKNAELAKQKLELDKQEKQKIEEQRKYSNSNEGRGKIFSYNLADLNNKLKNESFDNLMNSMVYSEKYGYRQNLSFYGKQNATLKNYRAGLVGLLNDAEKRSTGSDYDKSLIQSLKQSIVELDHTIKENEIKEKTEKSEIYNLKEKLTEQNNAHALQNILNNKNFKVSDLAPEWHRLSRQKSSIEAELKEVDKWEESTAKRQRQFDLRNKLASIVGGMNDITGLRIQSASEKMNNLMGSSFLTDNFGSFSKWAGRQNPMSVMVKEQNGLLKKILRELQLEKMSVPLFAR